MLDSALSYAARGWAVIPCKPKDKTPLTPHGVKDASTNPATIRAWWATWPDANIGLACGASGLVAIDLDSKNGGPDTWAELRRKHSIDDATVTSLTGGGGQHLIFRAPQGFDIRNSAGKLGAGVDIRANGGYIVVPPSVHPSGRAYTWEVSAHPDDLQPAPFPDALIRLLHEPAPKTTTASDNSDRIPNGKRNETLTSLAGSMRRRGMSPGAIAAALSAENATRCDPPLSEREVKQIATSVAVRYAPALPLVVFNHTDMGNAQRLVARHGEVIRFCTAWAKWLIWNGQRWQSDDTAEVMRLAKDTVRSIYGEAESLADDAARKEIAKHALRSESAYRIREMLRLAESESGIPVTPSQLDANPYLFNCANGTLDLRTGELRAHDPLDLITKMSPVCYDPNAQIDLWDSFVAWVTGDRADLAGYLQKAIGYGLTGVTSEEKLFMLLGPEATGKSTFAESIKSTLGDYARTADFESFLQRSMIGGIRNDIADLAGARFVVSIEVDEGKRLAEGLVKTITGGDTIKARHLYSEGFEFIPQFKLWLAANHAPKINADDGAMWRRIVRLPFERIIPKDKRDPKVKEYLRDAFIGGPAILAWAVKGCLRWQAEGLAEPDVITQATEAYRQEQDPLTDFIEECCIIKAEAWVSRRDFNSAFETWCKKAGEAPVSPRVIAALLRARFTETRSYTVGRGWQGIGLLAP